MNFGRRLLLTARATARAHFPQLSTSSSLLLGGSLALVGTAAFFAAMRGRSTLARPSIAYAAPGDTSVAKELEPTKSLADSLYLYNVIDVTEPHERVHAPLVPHSINIPLKLILDASVPVPDDKPLLLVCPGGARSMTAANALLARGYKDVTNLKGGSTAWVKAGLPVEQLQLKEISPSKGLEAKLPGYHVIDVREPEERVETGFVPGSKNLPLQTVLSGQAPIPVGKPLLMVCKSGRRSMKAAENLLQRGYDVTNLSGGTMGWIESGLSVERN